MTEGSILEKILHYAIYAAVGVIGFFLKRHMEKSDAKEKEQDIKIEDLDKRVDGHDVSRADIKARLLIIYQAQERIEKKIDRLLERNG